ncbi:MAG: hypothetical protein K5695_11885 [Oscillospiraceae bacterium]|nr:hypothetical protein [Oscillospiraceae bacterium]
MNEQNTSTEQTKLPLIFVILAIMIFLVLAGLLMFSPMRELFSARIVQTEATYQDKGYIPPKETPERIRNAALLEDLVERGFYCEIGKERSDEDFTVKLAGVGGEEFHPNIFLDVTAHETTGESLSEGKDSLMVCAYIMDEADLTDDPHDHFLCAGYGERDPEAEGLYHVTLETDFCELYNNSRTAVVIDRISFIKDELPDLDVDEQQKPLSYFYLEAYQKDPEWEQYDWRYDDRKMLVSHETEMTFHFETPDNVFKQCFNPVVDGIVLYGPQADYSMYAACLDVYESEFYVEYDFRKKRQGLSFVIERTDFYDVKEEYDAYWEEYAGRLVLEVDGMEYAPRMIGDSWYLDDEKLCRCNVVFPGVDPATAKSIVLRAGGNEFVLRG